MAKVVGQVIGGEERILDGMTTVADVKRELGVPSYTALVNGNPASDSQRLNDRDFVSLSTSTKGGC
jgi:hypothetical protein